MFGSRKVDRVDFVVAGVQKAGTTAFHDFLAQHPQIILPRDQALHFFDKEENFSGNPDYRQLHSNFDGGNRWTTAGEVTADYVYYPRALERIAEYNPQMKIVISLRNPADRAFSQWNMRRAKGNEKLDFIDAIKRDEAERSDTGLAVNSPRGNAHIDRSLYFDQVTRVFQLFPRERVLMIKYEDFRRDNAGTMNAVFDFLGVPRLTKLKSQERNVGPYDRKMTVEERAYVSKFFEEDIPKVEKLLGWDCSDWTPAAS